MKKADSDTSEEDKKPPARDNTAAEGSEQGERQAGAKRSRPEEGGSSGTSSRKRPASSGSGGAVGVAFMPGAAGAPVGRAASLKSPPVASAAAAASAASGGGSSPRKRPAVPARKRKSRPRPSIRLQVMEEEIPENETAEERRLRRNRINDRRKRARRAMKVEFLNEQYQSMRAQNDAIKTENQTLRDQISAIKRAMGMEDVQPNTPVGGGADTGEESDEAEAEEPGSQASDVIASSIRSRLDGSILAALNRPVSSHQTPQATAEEKTDDVQPEPPGTPQIQATISVASRQGAVAMTSPGTGDDQQQNQSIQAIAALLQRQQNSTQQPASPQQRQPNVANLDLGQPASQVLASLLSSFQQQAPHVGETPPTASTASQQQQSLGNLNRAAAADSLAQQDRNLAALISSLQSSTGAAAGSGVDVGNQARETHQASGETQQQRGESAETSANLLSTLRVHLQLPDRLLVVPGADAAETKEDPPPHDGRGPVVPIRGEPRQGNLTHEDLLSALQQHQGTEAGRGPSSSQSSSAAFAVGALLQSLQERTQQGTDVAIEGTASAPDQPQAGNQLENLAALLRERQLLSSNAGALSNSRAQTEDSSSRPAPELLATLQLLQNAGAAGSGLAGLIQQSESQRSGTLPPPESSSPSAQGLVDSLRTQHRGNPTIEGILNQLQTQLSRGTAETVTERQDQPRGGAQEDLIDRLQNQLTRADQRVVSQPPSQSTVATSILSQLQNQQSSGLGDLLNQLRTQPRVEGILRQLQLQSSETGQQNLSSGMAELLNQLQSQTSSGGQSQLNAAAGGGSLLGNLRLNQQSSLNPAARPFSGQSSGDIISQLLQRAAQDRAPLAPPPPANELVQQIMANQGLLGGQTQANAVAAAAAQTTPADLALAQSILSAFTGNAAPSATAGTSDSSSSAAPSNEALIRELASRLGGTGSLPTSQDQEAQSSINQGGQLSLSTLLSGSNLHPPPSAPAAGNLELLQQSLQLTQRQGEASVSARGIHSLLLQQQQQGGNLPLQGQQPQTPQQQQPNPLLQLLSGRLSGGDVGLGAAASSLTSQVLHSTASRLADPPSSAVGGSDTKDDKDGDDEDNAEAKEGDKQAMG